MVTEGNFSSGSAGKKFGTHRIRNYLSHGAHACLAVKTFVSCSWYSNLVIWCSIKIWSRTAPENIQQRQMSPFMRACCIRNASQYLCRLKNLQWLRKPADQKKNKIQFFLYYTFFFVFKRMSETHHVPLSRIYKCLLNNFSYLLFAKTGVVTTGAVINITKWFTTSCILTISIS